MINSNAFVLHVAGTALNLRLSNHGGRVMAIVSIILGCSDDWIREGQLVALSLKVHPSVRVRVSMLGSPDLSTHCRSRNVTKLG